VSDDSIFISADAALENKDYEKAAKLFLELSNSGDTAAMLRLASMYTCGEGVECDYERAIYWEKKAAEGGDRSAFINLGISNRIIGDIEEAKHWFERAVEAGDGEAALELAKLLMVSDKEEESISRLLHQVINSANVSEDSVSIAQKLLGKLGLQIGGR